MISLVLAMVWTRRGQALTLALLAMLAVSSAVAAPAYLIAAERAIADGQIATASYHELSLVARRTTDVRESVGTNGDVRFPEIGRVLLSLDGFTYHHSAEVPTVGLEDTLAYPSRLVFRQDVCAHVRIVTGRCLAGEGDVLLGTNTAERLGLTAGDQITVQAARQNTLSVPITWAPDAAGKTLTVAGTYRAIDPAEPYWGLHGYFLAGPGVGSGEPLFTGTATLNTMARTTTAMAIDGVAKPGTIDIDRLPELRADLDELTRTADELEESLLVDTGIPRLLERIEEGRSAARLLVPVLAVPLVLLACFTIYLTVGYGAQGRQSELAVVALRGSRWWTRWWLATGESLVAVLAGAVVGCLTGQLLVNAVTAALFPGVGADPALTSLRYAPIAALAALAAAVVAQRRQLISPVAGLLRRTPAADRRRLAVTEALVAVLALVTGAQFALADDPLTGVGRYAPALIILAFALLAARALLPLVNRWAGRALRRGRLGVALAGVQLSRRPGAGQLFALLVAAAAVAGYAAAAVDTAARGRTVEAELGTGADRVLVAQSTTRQRVLQAVRAVDPDGSFAMAVVRVSGGNDAASGLAVDSSRLAAVAAWPAGAEDPAEVAARLRPPAPDPVSFPGEDIAVDVTTSGPNLRLALSLSSLTGLGDGIREMGDLRVGAHTYRAKESICREGCRINGIRISGSGTANDITGQVTFRGLGTGATRWRGSEQVRLSTGPDGLRASVTVSASLADTAWIQPVSTPDPMPVAYAGDDPTGRVLTNLSFAGIPVTPVAELPAVPGFGRQAVLYDLEYTDRLATEVKQVSEPQVWLNAAAPDDIVQRLQQQGLQVVSDTSAAQVRAVLDQQGPAVALWFYLLAGVLAGLLGAGALALTVTVDRLRRTEDLTALRNQGLRARPAGQATLWTYPVLVVIATAVGLVVAVGAWRLTGWALPLAGIDPPDLPLPAWPGVGALLAAGGGVLVVQFLVAVLGGRDLRRRIESNRLGATTRDANGRDSSTRDTSARNVNGRKTSGRDTDGRASGRTLLDGRAPDQQKSANGTQPDGSAPATGAGSATGDPIGRDSVDGDPATGGPGPDATRKGGL